MRLRLPCRVLPAALVALCAASAVHAQDSISLDEYRARLGAYRRAVSGGKRAPQEAELRRRLTFVKRVRLPDGAVVTLDEGTWAEDAVASDINARAGALEPLLAPPSPAPSRPDTKEAARKILSAEEFREAATAPADSWLDRLMRSIGDAIRRFFDWLFGSGPSVSKGDGGSIAAFFAALLRFLLFVVATLAVVWGGLYVARYVTARRKRKAEGGVLSGLDLDDALTDPLGSARQAAARGEMRQALRLAYIACLRRLAAAGLLVLQESRTNWEYQTALRGKSSEAYQTLLPATRLFDLVWYGRREATLEEWELVMTIHDRLPEPLIEGTPTTAVSAGTSKERGNAW